MKYSLALEKQLEWLRSERFNLTDPARHGFDSMRVNGYAPPESMRRRPDELATEIAAKADPYFWDASLNPILEVAAKQLNNWTFYSNDLPTPYGFLWFERPVIYGSDFPVAANVAERPLDSGQWTGRAGVYCRWIAWGLTPDGIEVYYGLHFSNQDAAFMWSGVESPFSWTYGETRDWAWRDGKNGDGAAIDQYLFSAMAFMQQGLASTSRQRVDRATRRRLDLPQEQEPLVRVVELRRHTYHGSSTAEHESVDWSCRWLVRGHWRRQPYPSEGVVRPKWIAPYVKGPDDRPLKAVRATVFAVVR